MARSELVTGSSNLALLSCQLLTGSLSSPHMLSILPCFSICCHCQTPRCWFPLADGAICLLLIVEPFCHQTSRGHLVIPTSRLKIPYPPLSFLPKHGFRCFLSYFHCSDRSPAPACSRMGLPEHHAQQLSHFTVDVMQPESGTQM